MKKIAPIFLVLILFVMVVPAYAESPEDLPIPTLPQTVAASGETPSDVSVDIYGTVQASVISAEVTLASAFVINPNDIPENRFVSPDLSIKNTSNFPVQVMFVSLTKTGEAPAIVADSKYTDEQWNKLNGSDSRNNIALGLITRSTEFFVPAGGAYPFPTPFVLVAPDDIEPITMKAKHGLAFVEAQNYRYQLVLRLVVG